MTTETKHPEWWSEEAGFFGPGYLQEYDFLTVEKTVQEVVFLETILGLKPSSELEILDVPCGHGRHAVELAARGYNVTGFELNHFFLRHAESMATRENVPVHFVQGDMRQLPFLSEFDVVLNLFTALGYFDSDREDEKFFSGVYRSLKPGGVFVIDFINQGWLLRNYQTSGWRELNDGTLVIVERSFDYLEGRTNDVRTTITKDGTRSVQKLRHRVYAPHELITMGQRVGFTLKSSYGGFKDIPLALDSKRMILVFEKPS